MWKYGREVSGYEMRGTENEGENRRGNRGKEMKREVEKSRMHREPLKIEMVMDMKKKKSKKQSKTEGERRRE